MKVEFIETHDTDVEAIFHDINQNTDEINQNTETHFASVCCDYSYYSAGLESPIEDE